MLEAYLETGDVPDVATLKKCIRKGTLNFSFVPATWAGTDGRWLTSQKGRIGDGAPPRHSKLQGLKRTKATVCFILDLHVGGPDMKIQFYATAGSDPAGRRLCFRSCDDMFWCWLAGSGFGNPWGPGSGKEMPGVPKRQRAWDSE